MDDHTSQSNDQAAAPKGASEDSDSLIYEQADDIYETILDGESPYSELPVQPPPLPPSSIPTKVPLDSTEPQDAAPMIYDSEASKPPLREEKPQRPPSPVEYTTMKPDSESAVYDNNPDYTMVKKRGALVLEATDEYVPMVDTKNGGDADKEAAYQNIPRESHEGLYDVPRKGAGSTENQEKVEDSPAG